MRIRRVDVYAVRYRHAAGPFSMSGGRVSTEQDATVVRIETDDGHVGWGEQCAISPDYGPGYGPATRAVLALLARAVLDTDPRQVETVYARMDAAAKGYEDAKSAIDIACWDLFGHAVDLPLGDLLGGTYTEEFPLYSGVGIGAPEEMAQRCRAALAAGYRQVQVKVGTNRHDDIERIEACADALAAGADVMIIDANAWWTPADAVRVAAAVDRFDLFLEQPCATIAQCAQVRRTTRLPFILDESLGRLDDLLQVHAASAADAVRLKVSRFGGITPVRRARDLSATLGLPMTIEDSGGGDIVTAALAHIACSIPPRLLLSGYLPSEMTVERIATGTPVAAGGRAKLPRGPGLGVEVDEAALGEPVLRIE